MLIPKFINFLTHCRCISSTTAGITKIHRNIYARSYNPTVVVLPDGSSFNIRYHEPRRIIRLPLDLNTLSEEERKVRLDRRKPKKKIRVYEEVEDSFSSQKYIKMLKKK
ncbi:39S ribosomal protein L55, mitochondrial [Lutzomyia longipalpis]|uniref:Putative 39s ribosomal protein l55 n=1 Tax=Lutzomyia longipalpis TaxID=7200 RepID=A0A7G3A8Q5_LUTLO|nr:39S ribosomal protein L55, mitochondrial [Lutzomyia longipalpis]